MARVYYVDVAIPADRKKRGKHKTHTVFDGVRVFRVKKLTELEDASEIYIDTLFPEVYDEILELLRRDVRVYLLMDITKLKKLRMENNMRKSDENDAVLLAQIPKERFRPLTIEELELKIKMWPLIWRYRWIMRWRKALKKFVKHGSDYNFEELIRLIEAGRKKISEEIIRQVTSLPVYGEVYKKACEILGTRKSVELAILTIELPLHWSSKRLKRLKGLLGFTPNNKGRYNHKLRGHVARLAAAIYLSAKRHASIPDEIIEIVNHLPRKKAIYKIQLMVLKALIKAYLTTSTAEPAAGGQ